MANWATKLQDLVAVSPRKIRERLPDYEKDMVDDPDAYLDRNIGRQQFISDLDEMERLRKTGGPAAAQAKAIQEEQAKGQVAIGRFKGGGEGMRGGTQAASESYVQSILPVHITKQLASEGFSKEIAVGAGMLAMDDMKFREAILGKQKELEDYREGVDAQKEAEMYKMIGTLVAMGITGGAAAPVSDERAKSNLRAIPKDTAKDFLGKLSAKQFDYRPEFGGERGRMGPILNEDVANTEVGKSFIRRDPRTGYLMVDPAATALTTMALLKKQDERINALEKPKKGGK